MNRRRKGKSPKKGVENSASAFDLLGHPVKTLFLHFLNKVLLWLFTVATVLLIFPLKLGSIIVELVVLLIAFVVARRLMGYRGNYWRSVQFWFVVVTMFASAVFCPFVTCPKPLYVASTDAMWHSEVKVLKAGKKQIGSIMLLSKADAFRRTLVPVLQREFPNDIRTLDKTECQFGSYYSLPVFRGFIFSMSDTNSMPSKKNVYFPAVFIEKLVQITLTKQRMLELPAGENRFSIGCGLTMGDLKKSPIAVSDNYIERLCQRSPNT